MDKKQLDKSIEALHKHMNSPEGKASMERYVTKLANEDKTRKRHIEKFKSLYENDLDSIIEKLDKKYDSDEYVIREHKIGYQPREELFWLVYQYAQKYCKECKDEKYLNMFTGDAYYVGSYVVQIMHGQGSVVKVEKIHEEK